MTNPRIDDHNDWCSLRSGGPRCDCDWFEKQARPRCDCDYLGETLKKLRANPRIGKKVIE